MLDKVAILLKGKAAAGVVALLLAGSGGTVVAVAAQTHTGPFANTHASSGSTGASNGQAHGQSGDSHAHTVAIEGVLKSYDAGAKTIGVQKNGETSTTTIAVNDQTTVNGDQATSLADLANNLNHRVQVQADQQSDNSLLAWKITVGGPATPTAGNGDGSSNAGSQGSGSGDTEQRPLAGTVSSVNASASSFVLKETDGTTVTVTVSNTTQFLGSAHSLAGLKANMHVTVRGTKQSDGTIAATSVQIGA